MSAAEEILARLAEKKGISARQVSTLQQERPELFARAISEEPEEERASEKIEREAFARLLAAANPTGDPEEIIELTEEMRALIGKSLSRGFRRGKRAVALLEEERGFSRAILPLDFIGAPEALDYYALEYNSARAAITGAAHTWSEQLALDEVGEVENRIVASRRLSGEALRLAAAIGGLWHANAALSGCDSYAKEGEAPRHRPGCLHERSIIETSYKALARALYGYDGKSQRAAVRRDLREIESTPLAYSVAIGEERIEETGYLIESKKSAVAPGKGKLLLPLGRAYARLLYAGRYQLLPAWLLNRYSGAQLRLFLAVSLRPSMRRLGVSRSYYIGRKSLHTLGRVADWLPSGEAEPKRFDKWLLSFGEDLNSARNPETGEGSPLLLEAFEYRSKEKAWLLTWKRSKEGQVARIGGASGAARGGKLLGSGGQPTRRKVLITQSEKGTEKEIKKALRRNEGKTPEEPRGGRPTSIGDLLPKALSSKVEPTPPRSASPTPPFVEQEKPFEPPTIPQLLAGWRNLPEVSRKAYLRSIPGLAEALALDAALLPAEEPGE